MRIEPLWITVARWIIQAIFAAIIIVGTAFALVVFFEVLKWKLS